MLSFLLFLGAELVARLKTLGKEQEKNLQKQHFFFVQGADFAPSNFLF